MIHCRFVTAALCFFLVISTADNALAEGGTEVVATAGQPVLVPESWPAGAGEIVNDATRTSGWNSWFSEWPNDVNHYALEIKSTDDLNRLIKGLAAIKSDLRHIRLSYLKEPRGLGWVTQVPVGNKIPAIFTIGDQTRIDEWFKHVRKPFGVMEFTAVPVAVPPTLTIFVQNELVKLDELKIPEGVEVSMGHIPSVFYKSNTTIEQRREREAASRDPKLDSELIKQKLDEQSLEAMKKIEAFLEARNKTPTP